MSSVRDTVTGEPERSLAELRALVAEAPDDPELRYELALACEDAGDFAGMVREYLQVRHLDARHDRDDGIGTREEVDLIERVAAEVLDALPEPFASRLAGVPVVLEARPSLALVREGFDPRAFGLFEGPMVTDGDHGLELPARIVLFTSNLLASFAGDELADEVRITVLHEVGHYFGLDEDDMERLGLH